MKSIIIAILSVVLIQGWAFAQDQIVLDFPVGLKVKAEEACARTYGYREEIAQEDGSLIPNPETKPEFLVRVIERFIVNFTQADHINVRQEESKKIAITEAKRDIKFR